MPDTRSMREIWVETGVGMAFTAGAAAWSFDLDLWGTCTQGRDPQEAVAAFQRDHGPAGVIQQIDGDEQAFERDHTPASDAELTSTLEILTAQRERTLSVVVDLPDALLDRDDPSRLMPHWARWHTIRETIWHIADTESRYYLPQLGLPTRGREVDLEVELRASAAHVRTVLTQMPRDLVVTGDELWTSTKLLRRLAWHEAGELDAIRVLQTTWS